MSFKPENICSYVRLFWAAALGKGKREARYQILAALAKKWQFRLYHRDSTWYLDRDFQNILNAFKHPGGHTAKRYNLYHLAGGVNHLDGDTAECGVATGITSYLICRATPQLGRLHHAFDSFEGLPEPGQEDIPTGDVNRLKKGDFAVGLAEVQYNLADYEQVRYYPGWIPERFSEVQDQKFIFVHIDVDFYQATLDSIQFFYPRLTKGGILICDDYGFIGTPGATRAMDEFFADKTEPIVKLSAGHALIIRQ